MSQLENLEYVLMNPGGNRTILVETPVSMENQPEAAALLMQKEPAAEQVGFLTFRSGGISSLRMAGGEFCGNASMSAAVRCCMREGLSRGRILLEVSGASHPVSVEVEEETHGIWKGRVDMPRPQTVQVCRFPEGFSFPVVDFHGISHVIIEDIRVVSGAAPGRPGDREEPESAPPVWKQAGGKVELSESTAEMFAGNWCEYLGADALGLLFLDRAQLWMRPLVYVPAAGTCIWESACGSGTCAVGAWLARETGTGVSVQIRQPGGTLGVTVSEDGNLTLAGRVIREK